MTSSYKKVCWALTPLLLKPNFWSCDLILCTVLPWWLQCLPHLTNEHFPWGAPLKLIETMEKWTRRLTPHCQICGHCSHWTQNIIWLPPYTPLCPSWMDRSWMLWRELTRMQESRIGCPELSTQSRILWAKLGMTWAGIHTSPRLQCHLEILTLLIWLESQHHKIVEIMPHLLFDDECLCICHCVENHRTWSEA